MTYQVIFVAFLLAIFLAVSSSSSSSSSDVIEGSLAVKLRTIWTVGAESSGQMRHEKLHAVVAGGTFPIQQLKAPHVRTATGS